MFDRSDIRDYADHYDESARKGLAVPPQNFVIPTIIEKTARGERTYDLFSRLMEDRIVIVGGPINDFSSTVVVGQLLFLHKDNKNQDINIYIQSPGGSVSAGLAIYDTMQFVSCDVATFCVGVAASMGAVLLAGGEKGKRYSLPHARIMLHQPWGGVGGTAADIERQAQEIQVLKESLLQILMHHTGRTREQVLADTDRDYFMSAQDAQEYGLIDEAITTLKAADGASA